MNNVLNYSGACSKCGHRKRKHTSRNINLYLSSSCHIRVYRCGIFERCGCYEYAINNLKFLEQQYDIQNTD